MFPESEQPDLGKLCKRSSSIRKICMENHYNAVSIPRRKMHSFIPLPFQNFSSGVLLASASYTERAAAMMFSGIWCFYP